MQILIPYGRTHMLAEIPDERVQAVLAENEEAVLVVHPRISLSSGRTFLLLLPCGFALLWVLWAVMVLGSDFWIPLLFFITVFWRVNFAGKGIFSGLSVMKRTPCGSIVFP